MEDSDPLTRAGSFSMADDGGSRSPETTVNSLSIPLSPERTTNEGGDALFWDSSLMDRSTGCGRSLSPLRRQGTSERRKATVRSAGGSCRSPNTRLPPRGANLSFGHKSASSFAKVTLSRTRSLSRSRSNSPVPGDRMDQSMAALPALTPVPDPLPMESVQPRQPRPKTSTAKKSPLRTDSNRNYATCFAPTLEPGVSMGLRELKESDFVRLSLTQAELQERINGASWNSASSFETGKKQLAREYRWNWADYFRYDAPPLPCVKIVECFVQERLETFARNMEFIHRSATRWLFGGGGKKTD